MSEEKVSKKESNDQISAQSENTDLKENSKGTKNKSKTTKCCCLLLGVFLLIFVIFNIIRFFGGGSADTDISKIVPTPSNKYTTVPSATPPVIAPKDTKPQENQPIESEPEAANDTLNAGISKQAQIDYFIKVAIRDMDRDNAEIPLRKWGKNSVSIQIIGQSSPMANQCVNDTISAINSLSDTMKLSLTGGAGDIELNLTDQATLEAHGHPSGGYFYYKNRVGNTDNITGAVAYAALDHWPGEDVSNCQIIRHELTHTIGLPYNASGYDYSIFNVATTTTNEYQEIDKQMIKMLYNTGITSGLDEAEVRAYFVSANW